jgi:hypothetical protein
VVQFASAQMDGSVSTVSVGVGNDSMIRPVSASVGQCRYPVVLVNVDSVGQCRSVSALFVGQSVSAVSVGFGSVGQCRSVFSVSRCRHCPLLSAVSVGVGSDAIRVGSVHVRRSTVMAWGDAFFVGAVCRYQW